MEIISNSPEMDKTPYNTAFYPSLFSDVYVGLRLAIISYRND